MFKKIKNTIQNRCDNCEAYGEYKTSDKLNKDKTITKGELKLRYCERMDSELHDLEPCGMHRYGFEGRRLSKAWLYYLKHKKE